MIKSSLSIGFPAAMIRQYMYVVAPFCQMRRKLIHVLFYAPSTGWKTLCAYNDHGSGSLRVFYHRAPNLLAIGNTDYGRTDLSIHRNYPAWMEKILAKGHQKESLQTRH
ncbi:MAG: hypothetical protein ACYYK0_00160 [Candidatus Eutrophobiaceae bacterium]